MRGEECDGVMIEAFPVLGEPTTPPEPGDTALDNPAFWFDGEAFGMITAFDDLDHQTSHRLGDAILKDRAGIGPVGKQLAQERELPEQRGHQQHATLAILHIGGRHQRVQHRAQCIDWDMPLLLLDQFACIEPMWIDARPAFPRSSRSGCPRCRRSGSPHGQPARGISRRARGASSPACHPSSTGRNSRSPCCAGAGPSGCSATGSRCSAHTSRRSPPHAYSPCACRRRAWPVGSAGGSPSTPRRSDHSDNEVGRGHSDGGSRSSTSGTSRIGATQRITTNRVASTHQT
jgi:hypothetical protein